MSEAAAGTAQPVAAAAPAASGKWVRVTVTDAKVETKDGKQVLTVKVKTPGSGWTLDVRPLPANDPAVKELEVVGASPEGKAAGALEERTVAYPVNLGDKPDQPVLVHGAGAAIFAQ